MATYKNVQPQATSTNQNPTYFRSNFIPVTNIVLEKQSIPVLDILNPTYLKVLKNLAPLNTFTYTDGQQITTQAYKYDNTTSSWWLYILLNGYLHPYEMQGGDIVFVPNSPQAINTNNTPLTAPPASTVVF